MTDDVDGAEMGKAESARGKSGKAEPARTVTISVRALVVTSLVLLALAVAYLLGDAGGADQARVTSDAAPAAVAGPRTLTMAGTGAATAIPDQLSFTLAVGVTRPDLTDALDEANRTMERVLASLKDYGVKRGDVQTTGLSMNPVYDYPSYSPPVLRGYHVSERASVLVKELKQGGGAVSAAVAAGGNAVRVSDINLQVGDPDAVLAKARRAAVEEATGKAQEYAEATGQELGDVLTLREVSQTPRSDFDERGALPYAADAAGALASLPIRSGREELEVSVEVVWEFADGQR